ncbi:RNA polymerase sigma factor, SigC [Pseudonocardia sp. Ae168_Ps1]|uniref:sigma-70 family RNA polymerase sigma factor n=1 Tax=unclassified Pseudonocardia TaxID=2619320 RepID=UPI00094A9D41|nr:MULTISPECIES: sigma-70 family RNA polymerase sigma factor [unclassified Pseudonocardia]OLL76220.1 RNA polymerase sigma factor, SigC [Pseudonocardia sp. Ae150A_Ps1]OLL82219.1 RNA polymerase sigma factor, SigC [Pseudonocardia sp. Ae168_Ps1]OLL83665.1 RNA polymerase sigma factor, SigC [Pseudonocardia sp. Ae263_Ps1]OLL90294.1 RNA polymerase sigma factor, SigC [Pseudonocardia sp. Ae356_Ps1]
MSRRPDDATVTAWALAAGAGDQAALSSFVRATQADVHRFLVHLNGRADAEDLAQETYLRALRTLPTFEARSSARTWLLSVARRVAVDAVRTAVRRPRTRDLGEDTAEVIERALPRTGAQEAVLLRALIDDLAAERREAFVLTQVLDLGYAEAAEVCRCPVGTIRSRVARAREDLVRALDADGGTRTDRAGRAARSAPS